MCNLFIPLINNRMTHKKLLLKKNVQNLQTIYQHKNLIRFSEPFSYLRNFFTPYFLLRQQGVCVICVNF